MENIINDLTNICAVFGLDTNTNGLEDCELAHDLLLRIQTFLGVD